MTLVLQLVSPKAHKPAFKFGTIPDGSTETYLMKNKPTMHHYMKPFNKTTVSKGVKALKDGLVPHLQLYQQISANNRQNRPV